METSFFRTYICRRSLHAPDRPDQYRHETGRPASGSSHRRALFLLTILSVCLSCTYYTDVKIDPPAPRAVLNAILSPDSLLVAYVWRSTDQIREPDYPNGMNAAHYIKEASVEVFINGRSHGLMQADEAHTRYVLPGYRPVIGDRIELRASTPDYAPVSAVTEIPGPVQILSVDTVCSFRSDLYDEWGTIDLHLTFRDRPGEKNYYLLSFIPVTVWQIGDWEFDLDTLGYGNTAWLQVATDEASLWEKGHIEASLHHYFTETYYGFLITDEGHEGEILSIDVTLSGVHYSYRDSICTGTRTCRLLLSSISESYYFYRRSKSLQLEQNDILGDTGLREPVPTYSNVRNGYGLVGARQDNVREVVFPYRSTRRPHDYPYWAIGR